MELLGVENFITNQKLQEIFESDIPEIKKRNEIYNIFLKNSILFNKEVELSKRKANALESKNVKGTILNLNETNISEEQELIDVSYYLSQLQAFQDFENTANLGIILPHKNNVMFYNIINTILAYYLRECQEIEMFLATENVSAEERKGFQEEVVNIRKKIDDIISYRDSEDVLFNNTQICNNLVYLSTTSGNYYAFGDLKYIAPECYLSFLGLFKSIIDGTLKNVKVINGSNEKVNNIFEVKEDDSRIFFKRLNIDSYIILGCMIKKVDTSKYYFDYLSSRLSRFHDFQGENILLTDSYLKEQSEITRQLLHKLETESRKR